MNLLGQSYGGMVAQAYALKYPGFVERLILIDSFYSGKMWQANNDDCNCEIKTKYPKDLGKFAAAKGSGRAFEQRGARETV